ncbi:MAG: hypothetical protein AAGA68_21225 [Pseudomonadota bacterium]
MSDSNIEMVQSVIREVPAGRHLERRGLLEREEEQAWLGEGGEASPLDGLLGASIT